MSTGSNFSDDLLLCPEVYVLGRSGMKEDCELLMDVLPEGWESKTANSEALKGLRKDNSAEHLLRIL